MVTPSVKGIKKFHDNYTLNKCGNITNVNDSFTQAIVAKQLQHNNKVEEH